MANTKSAIKRIKTSEKRRQRNMAVRSSTRTFVKKARTTITQTPEEAKEDLVAAISALDRAARKGVIHPNNAARRKSRLMKLYNTTVAIAAAPAEAAPEEKPKRRTAAKKTTTAKAGAAKTSAAKTTAAKTTTTRTRAKKPAEPKS
jgi:small subunit ribosomal protein S20